MQTRLLYQLQNMITGKVVTVTAYDEDEALKILAWDRADCRFIASAPVPHPSAMFVYLKRHAVKRNAP